MGEIPSGAGYVHLAKPALTDCSRAPRNYQEGLRREAQDTQRRGKSAESATPDAKCAPYVRRTSRKPPLPSGMLFLVWREDAAVDNAEYPWQGAAREKLGQVMFFTEIIACFLSAVGLGSFS